MKVWLEIQNQNESIDHFNGQKRENYLIMFIGTEKVFVKTEHIIMLSSQEN